jgi:hypothetical protein
VTLAAGASSNINIWGGLEVAGSNSIGLTIVRTLVQLHVRNWALPADVIRAGILLGDLDDVGTTEQLAANFDKDWMWWYKLHPINSGSATVNGAQSFPADQPLDLRARRKSADMGRTAMLCMINGSASSMTVDVFVRQLVALP